MCLGCRSMGLSQHGAVTGWSVLGVAAQGTAVLSWQQQQHRVHCSQQDGICQVLRCPTGFAGSE